MAVTKIKRIHSTLDKSMAYITNKHKTDDMLLVDSFSCSPMTAHLEFELTAKDIINDAINSPPSTQRELKKHKSTKKDVLAYHIIQSFYPGETTPETAHEIGIKLADSFANKRHEYVLATHVDKKHIHNHIIMNSVDMYTHKKIHFDVLPYKKLREISDSLCLEYGLSVIKSPKDKGISYYEWINRNNGTSYKENLRLKLNELIPKCQTMDELISAMESLGFEAKRGKYLAFRAPDQERYTRVKSLGSSYTEEAILSRLGKDAESTYYKIVRVNPATLTADLNIVINSPGLEIAMAKSNIKKMNEAYLYMAKNSLNTLNELSKHVDDISKEMKEKRAAIHSLETTRKSHYKSLQGNHLSPSDINSINLLISDESRHIDSLYKELDTIRLRHSQALTCKNTILKVLNSHERNNNPREI